MSLRRIEDVSELHRYLQVALQLEHATIPPYLTALYSILSGTNSDAANILQSVVIEEMLHLLLVSNLLNALGGTPDFSQEGFVPIYPTHLPDGEMDFDVSIRPFSREAIETFLQIERPGAAAGELMFILRERSSRALLPAYVHEDDGELHFFSIGEFYEEIDRGLHWLYREYSARGENLFCGDPARQVRPDFEYHSGGEVIAVTDLDSADAVIRLICEQGEGLGGAIYDEEGELSHFYRFEQILLGRYYEPGDLPGKPSGASFEVDWTAVHPLLVDAHFTDYEVAPEIHGAAREFARSYQDFLSMLTRAHNGEPALLADAVAEMFRIRELLLNLICIPMAGSDGVHCAPIFAH